MSDDMLFDWDSARGMSRAGDPQTSKAAADGAKRKREIKGFTLLKTYGAAGLRGRTDEEAARDAGFLGTPCPWKRCSELRNGKWIVETGSTRLSDAGAAQMVCIITDKGRAALAKGSLR